MHTKPHIHVKKSFVWKHEYEAKGVQSVVIINPSKTVFYYF